MVKSARFSSFSPNYCYIYYVMIFPSSAAYLALSTLKNHQKSFWRKWRKIFQLGILLLKWPLLKPKMFIVHWHWGLRFIYSSFLSWKQNKVVVSPIQVNTSLFQTLPYSHLPTSKVYLHFIFAIYCLRLQFIEQ